MRRMKKAAAKGEIRRTDFNPHYLYWKIDKTGNGAGESVLILITLEVAEDLLINIISLIDIVLIKGGGRTFIWLWEAEVIKLLYHRQFSLYKMDY